MEIIAECLIYSDDAAQELTFAQLNAARYAIRAPESVTFKAAKVNAGWLVTFKWVVSI